jgi:hypothetical protein
VGGALNSQESTLSSTQACPADPHSIAPGVIRLVGLAREGALGSGDLVATRRLGTCEVVSIESTHTLTVRSLATRDHDRISGIGFGPGVRVSGA